MHIQHSLNRSNRLLSREKATPTQQSSRMDPLMLPGVLKQDSVSLNSLVKFSSNNSPPAEPPDIPGQPSAASQAPIRFIKPAPILKAYLNNLHDVDRDKNGDVKALIYYIERHLPSSAYQDAMRHRIDNAPQEAKPLLETLEHELYGHCSPMLLAFLEQPEPFTREQVFSMVNNTIDALTATINRYQGLLDQGLTKFGSPASGLFQLALEGVTPIARQKNIQLQIHDTFKDSERAQTGVHANDFKTYSMMWNLMQNAIKYSPSGSSVSIQLSPTVIQRPNNEQLPGLELVVEDSGIGIPPEEHENVFNGYRGRNALAANIPGTGFGLAECAKFALFAKGKLTLQSPLHPEKEMPGSRFILQLPLLLK